MRRGGAAGGGRVGRRFTKVSTAHSDRSVPLATAFDMAGGRDSDASLCSSRPSSVGVRTTAAAAPSSRKAALQSVNAFLASHSAPISLDKPPPPAARDIADAFRFILQRLDWPAADLESDLPAILRHLRCPFNFNRSMLQNPGAPRAWPTLLSVLHWLVQLARVSDHLSSSPQPDKPNDLLLFVTRSYSLFICGEDDAVSELDDEYLGKAEHQAANAAAAIDALEKEAKDLEDKLQALQAEPSRKEALQREKDDLVVDVQKFQSVVNNWSGKIAAMEASLLEWEKELEAKEKESKRLCEENEELQKRIGTQAVNVRDVERMRREMQAVERDIASAESERNRLEEKTWDLEASISRKLNEIEGLLEECNQAVRKLKLGTDFQYVLDAKGSSPAKVIGVNYKTVLKPALSALAEEMKRTSISKLEESMSLQKQSTENAEILEKKKDNLVAFQARIDEAEALLTFMKNEAEEFASKCYSEAEKMKDELIKKENQLKIVEKEAEDFLKKSDEMLLVATKEVDGETQMCARELLALIDAVSQYKEFMESTISGMKTDLSETAGFISSLSAKFVSTLSDFSQGGRKRARYPIY